MFCSFVRVTSCVNVSVISVTYVLISFRKSMSPQVIRRTPLGVIICMDPRTSTDTVAHALITKYDVILIATTVTPEIWTLEFG
jgi:hypothetical protein